MKLSPTELMKLSYNQQQWNTIMEQNSRLLNDTLLKMSGLLDVDLSGIADNNLLQYNSVSGKYEPVALSEIFTTTTTTTTSTTSTTTTL